MMISTWSWNSFSTANSTVCQTKPNSSRVSKEQEVKLKLGSVYFKPSPIKVIAYIEYAEQDTNAHSVKHTVAVRDKLVFQWCKMLSWTAKIPLTQSPIHQEHSHAILTN